MHTLVIASRKGGAGKTTLATLLAVEAARVGGSVAVIDLDPMRGLTLWWEARSDDTPTLITADGGPVAAIAAAKASSVRLVLIDTPPADAPIVASVIGLADLVIVPVQPSPHDLRAVGATVDLARRVKRPLVFVINRTKPRVRLTGEAAIALSQHGTVSPAMLADRSIYAAAAIDGRTAPEVEPGGAAAAEVAALWSYLVDRLETTP